MTAPLDEMAYRVPRGDGLVSTYGASRVQPSFAAFVRRDPCPWIVWRSDWTVRKVDAIVAACPTEEAARAALALLTGGISPSNTVTQTLEKTK